MSDSIPGKINAYYNNNSLNAEDTRVFQVHPFYELFYFISGQSQYYVDGTLYRMSKGDILLINKGGIHSSPGTQRLPLFRRIVVHFTDPDIIDTPNNDIHSSLFEHTSGGGKFFPSALCKGFPWEHYLRQIVDADDLHTQRLYLSTLLREMSMHYPNLSQKREAKGTADEIISYINTISQFTRDDAYNNALSVKSICDKFHISPPHLNHITESLVGTTAMKYIMRNRMNRAQYLLQTGRPPSHVYNIVGFSDYSGFYRAYLRHFGHSPSVDYIKK